jgi:hypothetical protein
LIRDEIRKEARRLRVLPRATSIKLSFFVERKNADISTTPGRWKMMWRRHASKAKHGGAVGKWLGYSDQSLKK